MSLDAAVAAAARGSGVTRTRVPRQSVVTYDRPARRVDMTYEPMLCLVTSGEKRPDDGTHHTLRAGDMLLCLTTTPVVASFAPPYRSVTLAVDLDRVPAIDRDVHRSSRAALTQRRAMHVAPADDDLVDAVTRWVRLGGTPVDIAALASRYEDEILYRVLRGPFGEALRQAASAQADDPIRRAINRIADDYASRSLTAEALAASVGLGSSAFFERFRAHTGLTPHRYVKKVRLQHARALLESGSTAAAAAHAVGYLSPAHFSRDYARQYGQSPRRHARGDEAVSGRQA